MCPCIVVQMMSKMDGHYIKAFLRFVGCCCGPVADTHVFYHLGYNDGLYFGSNKKISWLVDKKWDDRTPPTNTGQGSG